MCPNGFVYNIEVDVGEYIADGYRVHNCAHATAGSWRKVLDRYQDAVLIGLTATPCRLDGRGLGEVFGAIVEPVTTEALIEQGHLIRPTVFAPPGPNLAGIPKRGGDYAPGALAERMGTFTGDMIETWQRCAPGLLTIAFGVNIEHSLMIRDAFRAAGVAAEHLDGTTPKLERDAVLARLAAEEITVLSNCALLGEGWDLPALRCAILARPTMSLALYRQQVGRIMRPPGPAIVLDHAGNTLEHGLVTDPIEWTLEGRARKDGPAPPAVRICKDCYAVLPIGSTACPQCGVIAEAEPPDVTVSGPGELVPVGKIPPRADRENEYRRLVEHANLNGYRLGWARMRYKDRFQTWPRHRDVERELYRCTGHEWEAREYGPKRVTRCKRCYAER